MPTDSGFSNQKMRGPARHQTVQTMGSDRVGIPTAQMYLYEKTAVAIEILTVTKVPASKLGKPDLLEIEFDGPHLAKKFDVMRIIDNVLEGWEFEIIKVVDATTIQVYNIGDIEGVETLPSVGDTIKTLRWTTALSDQSGALQVSQGPLQFTRNGATQTVIEDTVTPGNNRPLPVMLSSLAGPVTVNAGDLYVKTDAANDSMRLGDGTNLTDVTADGELKVWDEKCENKLGDIEGQLIDSLVQLGLIEGKDFATQTTLEAVRLLIASLDGKDFATQTTLAALLAAFNAEDFATQTTLAALLAAFNAEDFASQTTLATLATEAKLEAVRLLIASLDGKDFATQTTLAALSAKLPATLGQKAMAASLAVTLASDQSTLPVAQAAKVGSYQEDLTVTDGAVETFVAPAGSKWCKIQADDTNVGNARIKIGAAATTTSGLQLQPGRSEDFEIGGDISYTMEAGGTGKLYVQFGV